METDQATASRRRSPPKTLVIDWTHPPKANGLYHTSFLELEPTGKQKLRLHKETPGAVIWRLKQKGLVTPGDNLRGWPRIGIPGETKTMMIMMMMMRRRRIARLSINIGESAYDWSARTPF